MQFNPYLASAKFDALPASHNYVRWGALLASQIAIHHKVTSA